MLPVPPRTSGAVRGAPGLASPVAADAPLAGIAGVKPGGRAPPLAWPAAGVVGATAPPPNCPVELLAGGRVVGMPLVWALAGRFHAIAVVISSVAGTVRSKVRLEVMSKCLSVG